MNQAIVTTNSKNTQQVAQDFASQLHPGDVVVLSGDLGAGKTTFVQGLAKGLGITKRIISPTFVIIRSYEKFYHVDLYRLSGENDVEATGLLDIMNQKDSILAIEWPDKLGKFLPKKRWEVRLENLGEEKRKIEIKKV